MSVTVIFAQISRYLVKYRQWMIVANPGLPSGGGKISMEHEVILSKTGKVTGCIYYFSKWAQQLMFYDFIGPKLSESQSTNWKPPPEPENSPFSPFSENTKEGHIGPLFPKGPNLTNKKLKYNIFVPSGGAWHCNPLDTSLVDEI